MVPIIPQDPALAARLESLSPEGITLFTLGGEGGPKGGDLRGAVIQGTGMVTRMRESHGLGLLETLILGQAYLAAALVASTLKGRDRISLFLSCEGPAKGWSVEGRSFEEGRKRSVGVRGYLLVDNIPVEAPVDSWDSSPFIGSGSLTLTRFMASSPRPHSGAVRLASGRLAEDLARYYLESEQTKTAFNLSVAFDGQGQVAGAGGIFLQALPGAREEFVGKVEAGLLGLPSLGSWFAEGKASADLLRLAFSREGLVVLGTLPAEFSCDCSRERFAAFLEGAGDGLLDDLVTVGPWPVVVTCHNCGTKYDFPKVELEAMAARRGIALPPISG